MTDEREKERLTVYLTPEAYQRLVAIAERCAAEFGRKAGRGNGWNSTTLQTALESVTDDELLIRLAAKRQAA